jgi:hypothetical protein
MCEWVAVLIMRKICLRRTTTMLPLIVLTHNRAESRRWCVCENVKCVYGIKKICRLKGKVNASFLLYQLPSQPSCVREKENRPLVLFFLRELFLGLFVALLTFKTENTEVAHAKFSFL